MDGAEAPRAGVNCRRQKADRALERRTQRALIRQSLRKLLSARVARLLGETAIPGLDIAAGIETIAEIAASAEEFFELKRDIDAALGFAKNGPYRLEDLLVDKEERSFSTYAEFKKRDLVKFYGPAGEGFEYHHLILQSSGEGVAAGEMHSSRTIVRIPKLLHEEISGEYERKDENAGLSLRQALKGCTAREQYEAGIEILRRVGIIR